MTKPMVFMRKKRGWCSSESDGSQCRCAATVKKQKPMGPVHTHQRTVSELSTMPYGMRLARGFAILSGNKHDL